MKLGCSLRSRLGSHNRFFGAAKGARLEICQLSMVGRDDRVVPRLLVMLIFTALDLLEISLQLLQNLLLSSELSFVTQR